MSSLIRAACRSGRVFSFSAPFLVPLLFSREISGNVLTLKTKDSAGEEEVAEHSTSLFIAAVFVIVAARGRRAMVMRPLRGAAATAASGLVERAEAGKRARASSAGREAATESMLMEKKGERETSFLFYP